ncbi:MAG: heme-binding protein [Chloroflexota bacterium]|nr:MAG: heme-binding protein [Chloroflexota bacterium]
MRQLITLSHQDAQRAIEAMQAECDKRGKGGVLVVTDAHGELIALLRMDGAPFSSIQIALNKAYTAARERKPSYELGQKARDPERGFPMTNFGELRYTTWGGGLPIVIEGEVVGAVAISGLPEQEDMEIAELGRQAALGII